MVVPCTIIAVLAGPSSANLLIPRQGNWLTNPRSRFSLNATFSDIWPDQLDGTQVPAHCAALQQSAADALCPSYDWTSIQSAFALLNYSIYLSVFEDTSHRDEFYFNLQNDLDGFSKVVQSLLCTSSATD